MKKRAYLTNCQRRYCIGFCFLALQSIKKRRFSSVLNQYAAELKPIIPSLIRSRCLLPSCNAFSAREEGKRCMTDQKRSHRGLVTVLVSSRERSKAFL